MIILTGGEANLIRLIALQNARLEPIELVDGTWALPIQVKTDPTYAVYWNILEAFPTRPVDISEYLTSDPVD